VLVVSGDLRRPAIHEMFGVAERPGLTDVLRSMDRDRETFKVAPYLKPCAILRVAVLPGGSATDRPAELLGSAAMRRLVERLKQITDVVILDCAPLVVAGDVVPLLPMADGVVVVARAGTARHHVAASSATLLERYGVAKAGVVLNDAREFSIPLAKRRMYRPTRETRKAVETKPPGRDDELWVVTPDIQTQVVDEPVQEVEPSAVREETRVAEEHDELVRIPDLPEPTSSPVEEGSRPNVSASEGLKVLREELTALRAELEDVQTEPPERPRDPTPSFPVGFRPGSGHGS
jgi:Mrp family chromosome partitioning ATPase